MADRKRHPTLFEQYVGKCRHFNGCANAACKAGINYKELAGTEKGYGLVLPCFAPERRDSDKEPVVCPKHAPYSAAEAQQKVDEHHASMERLNLGVAAAQQDADAKGFGRGHGGVGAIPCPTNCGGTLHYTVSDYNGHMHGRCTTEHCLWWME